MVGLSEGVGVEEVAGAVDDINVGGCTELLVDVAKLNPELFEVETLDKLAIIDDASEL